jgi:glucose/mannose-6-phosphate isomerase
MIPTIDIIGSSQKASSPHLDDLAVHRRLDTGAMLLAIEAFPDHLRQAPVLAEQVDWLSYKPTTPAGVCVCGMGGSAIGGDLVRSYWESESPVPMVVVRSDHLPEYINRFWMVIASSYSGKTQETLSAVDDARRKGSNILALTSGGRLSELARSCGWPSIVVPGGMMPRAALGYSFGPVMFALIRWGIVPDRALQLAEAVSQLSEARTGLGLSTPMPANSAKQAAAALTGRYLCIYGTTGFTDVVAMRLKCQFAENSKAVAFANSLPELNHNEIVGMDASADPSRYAVVIVRSGEEPPAAQKRLEWVTNRLSKRGIPVVMVTALGDTRMARMLSLIQFGDYVSYYLAIAMNQDPTPIPAIESLKMELQ